MPVQVQQIDGEGNVAPVAKTPGAAIKLVGTPGTGTALASAALFVRRVWFRGRISVSASNAGDVWIKTAAGDCWGFIRPGEYWEPPIEPDLKIDLQLLKVDGVNGTDGVLLGWIPA